MQKQRVSEVRCKGCENDFFLLQRCGPYNELGTTGLELLLKVFYENSVLVKTVSEINVHVTTLCTGLPQNSQNLIPGLSRTFLSHFSGLFQDFLK